MLMVGLNEATYEGEDEPDQEEETNCVVRLILMFRISCQYTKNERSR